MRKKRSLGNCNRIGRYILAGLIILWLGPVNVGTQRAYSWKQYQSNQEASMMESPPAGTNTAFIRKQEFYSVQGRPIQVYEFGGGERCSLVLGGIHGDEAVGTDLAHSLLKHLQSLSMADFQGKVILIPVVNPDGLAAKTRRNANHIDINRNFPTANFGSGRFSHRYNPGEAAASEPETQMILNVAGEYQPDLIIALHSDLGCVNYDGPGAEIAAQIAAADRLPVKEYIGYATPGSLGTYYGRERNIAVITLELLSDDNQWNRHGKAILTAMGVVNPKTE